MTEEYEPTLKNIVESHHKYIYVGGKGGVGKTTTSSSLGVLLSKYRKSVLIISTDPAHNLGDSFDQKFTSKPTKVNGMDNLFCMEIDPSNYLNNIPLEQLVGVENNEYTKSVIQEITSSFPGIDEATSLGEVMKLIRSFDYETIIFDTAPTGHTLRLLNLPNIIEKGLSKMLFYQQKYGNIINQVTSIISTDITKVQQKMVDYLIALKEAVEEMNKKFKDPKVTTFIAVCIPEFLSLYETERLVVELSKFEIDICNIVINQVLFPDTIHPCKMCTSRKTMQMKYIKQIYEMYEDFHIILSPLQEEEVRGIEKLRNYGEVLLKIKKIEE